MIKKLNGNALKNFHQISTNESLQLKPVKIFEVKKPKSQSHVVFRHATSPFHLSFFNFPPINSRLMRRNSMKLRPASKGSHTHLEIILLLFPNFMILSCFLYWACDSEFQLVNLPRVIWTLSAHIQSFWARGHIWIENFILFLK